MRILVDTNVILDVICKRKDFYESSLQVMKYCEVKKIEGYISALSIPNIVYIMRKELDNKKIKTIITKLNMIFKTYDLKINDLIEATDLDFNDYEDAIQAISASKLKANYIVTRNTKDFKSSVVPSITPSDLLRNL